MSETIQLNGWISVIPSKMYLSFIDRKFFKYGDHKFCEQNFKDGWMTILRKKFQKGFTIIPKDTYIIMQQEIGIWYKDVFTYIKKWLKKNKLMSLKRGTFDGGFCVEENEKSEVVKKWCAPVGTAQNRVCQIKEKFGEFRVYFTCLNKAERAKVDKFAILVAKKFDCITVFC
jgi:predicted AlkP superfamily phosphohydrolase/phosphomutase